MRPAEKTVSEIGAAEKTYKDLSFDNLMQSMQVNAIGPALVMKHFMELLLRADTHGGATSLRPAIIANMSARFQSARQMAAFSQRCATE